MVPQQIYLFNCSIKDNILLGNEDLLDDFQSKEIIKLLNFDNLLSRLDNGWDTIVGDSGTSLSGGEKQKVGIIRALLRNPLLIIWDEPLTYLDNENQNKIKNIIEYLRENGKSQLIITHDKSLFSFADKILHLKNSKISVAENVINY